jgi:hypothetical protein
VIESIFILFFILGPLIVNLFANFELNENYMKTIRSYICYTCLSWLKPLYNSINKKINLSIEENDIIINKLENKTYDEIIILTHQFREIFKNYIHDLMDPETLDYFKAKNEIERINQLLTTTDSSSISIGGKFFFLLLYIRCYDIHFYL